ncbi:hypothetical protein [Caulobacter sp.]|nr:hypothetical protein [Caulobacter sp.]HJV40672.1 hypothetical protein [Caulobacter sp.]
MAFRRTAPSTGSSPEPPRRACGFVQIQLTAKDDALRPRPFFMPEWRL